MKIKFLYWEECPSHQQALARLHQVMREESIALPVDLVEVDNDERAQQMRFPGSPTILINGHDIAPPSVEEVYYGLTCRTYRHEDGRISPLPSEETIRRALLTAVSGKK